MALMSIVHEAKLNIDYRVGTYSFFMIEGVMQKIGAETLKLNFFLRFWH